MLQLRPILGHRCLATTQKYLRTSSEDAPFAHIDARPHDPAHPAITPPPEENLLQLRGILGHQSLATTQKYLRTSTEDAVIAHIEGRHAAATEMLRLHGGKPEENLLQLRGILGHHSLATTQTYLRTSSEDALIAHIEGRSRPLDPAHPVLTATSTPEQVAPLTGIHHSTGDNE